MARNAEGRRDATALSEKMLLLFPLGFFPRPERRTLVQPQYNSHKKGAN